MNRRLGTGEGISIAGVWVAIAAVTIASRCRFAVMIFPLVVPLVAVGGGVAVTIQILSHRKEHETPEKP